MIDLKPLRNKYGRRNNRLQAGPVHVPQLAKVYGVDQRSIQRDLRELVAAGFSVERGDLKGWWRTK